MKTIDWKEMSSNATMSEKFSLEIFNKFESLANSEINSDNIDQVYNNIIKATEEVVLVTLPEE